MTSFMISNGIPAPPGPDQLNNQEENLFPHSADKRRGGACTECLKVPIDQMERRRRSAASLQCQHCKNPMCKVHRVQVCMDCKTKLIFRTENDSDVDGD